MSNHAAGAAAHRLADEAMAVVPFSLEGDKDRPVLDFIRIRHDFSESCPMTLARDLAAGRRENFCLAPPHPSFYYPQKAFAACANFPLAIPAAWTMTRTPLLTTKITKDTKVSEILFLNFVLFVSFVVQSFPFHMRLNRAGRLRGGRPPNSSRATSRSSK